MFDMRFYIKGTMPDGRERWVAVKPVPHLGKGAHEIYLFSSAICAEAFEMRDVEKIRQFAETIYAIKFEPIECNSRKLIPENMRKVLQL